MLIMYETVIRSRTESCRELAVGPFHIQVSLWKHPRRKTKGLEQLPREVARQEVINYPTGILPKPTVHARIASITHCEIANLNFFIFFKPMGFSDFGN